MQNYSTVYFIYSYLQKWKNYFIWKLPILAVTAFTFAVCMLPPFRKAFDCVILVPRTQ